MPTHITLLSADTNHSFWVPQLAGKTDLIPNRVNSMWVDPHETGNFVGQCAQYCGTQHAKMLLRVIVESREDFDKWVANEKQSAALLDSVNQGRHIFESGGLRGPALDSVATILTHDQLVRHVIQGGGNMPAYGKNLNPAEVTALVSFLETLHPPNRTPARDASQAAIQQQAAPTTGADR